MAKKVYGTTLWGKNFLSAIEQETDHGRLSRGKTYANTGKIYDVQLQSKTISAKVKGNYAPFYSTQLTFIPFKQGDIDRILNFIEDHPFVLADIMNGKLSNDLLAFIRENEIDLFRGFDMSCDCYDYYGSYACKHIAALYYVLTSEIDKNPFILLELRQLDLIDHYNIKKELTLPYPLELNFTKETNIEPSQNNLSLLQLKNYRSFILTMLTGSPPFASVDYKEVMEEFYKKVPKELPLLISPIRNEQIDTIQRVLQDSHITLQSTTNMYKAYFKIDNSLLHHNDGIKLFDAYRVVKESEDLLITPINLFTLFISFEDSHGTSSYRYLFYLFRVAYILIEHSGFIPAVVENKTSLQIIYKPLSCVETINKQIELLSSISPSLVKMDEAYLDAKSGTYYLLSAILTQCIPQMDFMHKKQKSNPPRISQSFFQGIPFEIEGFEDQHIAYSINNYFSVFDSRMSGYIYTLHIDRIKSSYALGITIQDKTKMIQYPLNRAVNIFNKIEIVRFLSFLNQFLPSIQELITQESIELTHNELETFLLTTSGMISNLGVEIVLPKELKTLLKPTLSLNVKSTSNSLQSFFTLKGLLQYDWKVSIGEESISVDEFEELLKNGQQIIQFKDHFITITPDEAKAIFSTINQKKQLSNFEILQAKLNDQALFEPNVQELFDDLFSIKEIHIPSSLNATLREYQRRGFQWSVHNLLNGFGTILADDMGLGKTVQAIATILYLKEQGYINKSVLVVLPTSLLSNWERELDKFAPSLSYFSFYGSKRVLKDADVTLTTYDLVRRDIQKFNTMKIDCLIIDEAQKIKNPNTNITLAIKSLKAPYKIALSGTPVENNLSELWSIFDFCLPKYLKSLKEFTAYYAKDIEIHQNRDKIEQLKKITAPFMLRRLKTNKDIIADLPDKIIIDEYATMTKEQASLYKSVVDAMMEKLNDSNAKGLIFKLIIELKQICNHPRNFDKRSDSSMSLSGKAQLLVSLLQSILLQDEKVLIFTQYTQMADILVDIIQKELFTTPLVLQGSMSKKQRDDVVKKFQEQREHKIFILSLKAGGVGLNLTAANHVIHYDLWFNPAVENQATDRAFRIGQSRNVNVYRFITKNSFEEKIDKMIKAKQELSNLSVHIGENWLKDMTQEDLKNIFN